MSEKTEKATPNKLKESRKKGQIGQSQDIPKLFICVAVLETIFAMVETGMQRMEAMLMLPLSRLRDPFDHALEEVITDSLTVLLWFVGTVCAVAVFMRILGGWVQFGPLFAVEALKPKFESLNPINHFKNIFSARQFTQLLTSVIKASIIGLIVWQTLEAEISGLTQLALGTLDSFWQGVMELLKTLARRLLMVILIFSALDFGIQKYFYLKQQRMSHEDIKNEYKQNEGDPHMKGHRRQVAHEILEEEPHATRQVNVEDADVLLINPTHFAVGLFYRAKDTPLPLLVFKERDSEAQALVEAAQRTKIPVIRYVWLARTLYHTTKEGDYIPRETLTAVAQVYRLLRELEDHYLDGVIEINE